MAQKKPLTTLDSIRKELWRQGDQLVMHEGRLRKLDDITRVAWRDLDFSAVSAGKGTTAPDVIQINSGTIYGVGFDGGVTTEQIFGAKEVDHDWYEHTPIEVHVHWKPSTADAGNVQWNFTYTLQNGGASDGTGIGDVMPAETTLSATQTSSGVAWQEHFLELGQIDMSEFRIGAQVAWRFYRDPSLDTYPEDAVVDTIGIHMRVYLFGSRTEGNK